MKIAINTLSIIPGKVGGTEIFLVNLLENLLRIDNKNEYLLIVSSNNKKAFNFNYQNVSFLELRFNNNSRAKRVFFEQFYLPIKIKKKNVDLFIAPGNTGLVRCPCKQLLIVHDLIFFVYPKHFSFIKRTYLHKFVKYSCKVASRIVTMSKNTKNDIVKYIKANEDKINVIYEGVDFEKFSRIKRDEAKDFIRRKYNIKNYVYSPTSLYPHKNNDLVIEAFTKLKKEKKVPQKLIITGIDPYKKMNWLKDVIAKYEMENEVFYLGRVPGQHLPYLYSGADAVAYLSSYEGFGLPVLEAMAAGCPVLSSNRSSLPEVVGDAGVLVDPFNIEEVTNKMYELLTNENLRKEYIAKGLARAKQFSWENVARRFIKIYGNL